LRWLREASQLAQRAGSADPAQEESVSSYIPGDPAGIYSMGRGAGLMTTPQAAVPGYGAVDDALGGLSSWLVPAVAGLGVWLLARRSSGALRRLAPALGLTTVFGVRWVAANAAVKVLTP
jgi:hypothetical protein